MFCIFYKIVSQVWPQEETEERLRKKAKFITLTDPRDRRHGTLLKALWEKYRNGQEEEVRSK